MSPSWSGSTTLAVPTPPFKRPSFAPLPAPTQPCPTGPPVAAAQAA
jgi:hypothetical protein